MLKIALAAILPVMMVGEVFGELKYMSSKERKEKFQELVNAEDDVILKIIEFKVDKIEESNKNNIKTTMNSKLETLNKQLKEPNIESCKTIYNLIMQNSDKDKQASQSLRLFNEAQTPANIKKYFLRTYLQYKTAEQLISAKDDECKTFQKAIDAETDKTYPLFIIHEIEGQSSRERSASTGSDVSGTTTLSTESSNAGNTPSNVIHSGEPTTRARRDRKSVV